MRDNKGREKSLMILKRFFLIIWKHGDVINCNREKTICSWFGRRICLVGNWLNGILLEIQSKDVEWAFGISSQVLPDDI
jgi:hypothetical protein